MASQAKLSVAPEILQNLLFPGLDAKIVGVTFTPAGVIDFDIAGADVPRGPAWQERGKGSKYIQPLGVAAAVPPKAATPAGCQRSLCIRHNRPAPPGHYGALFRERAASQSLLPAINL
jgi:hypothetical protein